jgi:hypothetical protein
MIREPIFIFNLSGDEDFIRLLGFFCCWELNEHERRVARNLTLTTSSTERMTP